MLVAAGSNEGSTGRDPTISVGVRGNGERETVILRIHSAYRVVVLSHELQHGIVHHNKMLRVTFGILNVQNTLLKVYHMHGCVNIVTRKKNNEKIFVLL